MEMEANSAPEALKIIPEGSLVQNWKKGAKYWTTILSFFSYFSYVHIVVGGKVQKIPTGSPAGVSSD